MTWTWILIADFCFISSIKKQLWKGNTVILRHIEVFGAHWWQHNKYLSESNIHWLLLIHSSYPLSLPRFKWPFFVPQGEEGQTRSPQQLAEGYWGLGKPVAGAQQTHTRYFLAAGLETGSCQHGNEGEGVILHMNRIKVTLDSQDHSFLLFIMASQLLHKHTCTYINTVYAWKCIRTYMELMLRPIINC